MRLNQNNYYGPKAGREYFSVSQYKDFDKCESMAMAKIKGEYKQPMTKALLVGSFVDSYFEGTLEQFLQENPAVYTRKKELRSEFRKASEIIERVKTDERFIWYLSGEKQKILTFELFGVPWKMKMDSYLKDMFITDLKVVKGFDSLYLYRYDLQGAVYQKGVELNHGKKLPFYLAAVTKETVIDLDIYQVPQENLDAALEEIGRKIGRFNEVKKGVVPPLGCGHCDYCKSKKKASVKDYNDLIMNWRK